MSISSTDVTLKNLDGARAQICVEVDRHAGIHFRGLARATGFSAGQLRYHVDRLRRMGVLLEVRDGGYTRFFLAARHEPRMLPALAAFQRRLPREIATLLAELGPLGRGELRRALGCADSTLSFHLVHLLRAGLVVREGRGAQHHYALADPELARRALAMLPPEVEAQVVQPVRAKGLPPADGADERELIAAWNHEVPAPEDWPSRSVGPSRRPRQLEEPAWHTARAVEAVATVTG